MTTTTTPFPSLDMLQDCCACADSCSLARSMYMILLSPRAFLLPNHLSHFFLHLLAENILDVVLEQLENEYLMMIWSGLLFGPKERGHSHDMVM
eukprot:scaffold23647_cov51-Attheya_sp.AAC.5